MAISFVNSAGNKGASASTTIAAPALSVTSQNTLIVCVSSYTSPKRQVSTITDTVGNTYTLCGTVDGGGANHSQEVWIAKNAATNTSNVVTVTFTGSASNRVVAVLQYSGIYGYEAKSTLALDSLGTTHTCNAVTTLSPNALVLGFFVQWTGGSTITASAPSTSRVNQTDSLVSEIIGTSAGAYAPVATSNVSDNYAMTTHSFSADQVGGSGAVPDDVVIYCIEMTVYDPAIPGTKVLRYATVGGVYGGNYYEPRLKQPGNFSAELFPQGRTFGSSQIGFGEAVLVNKDKALDGYLNYGFDGRVIVFKKFTATLGLVLLTSCTMEQPVFTGNDEISIRIKDPNALLSVPVQTNKYGGTNVSPLGVDGTSDIKGKPKPLNLGTTYNITPECVNTSKLIYQVHDGAVQSIPGTYDKGVQLVKGTDYISQADMEANQPGPNQYRCWLAGGMYRLGSTPAGQVTNDVIEGATAGDRTAAQIAKRIAARAIPSGDVYAQDVIDLDAANSAEVGIYIKSDMTVGAAIDEVLGSIGAWNCFDANVKFRMGQLTVPTSSPDVTITKSDYLSIERVATSDTDRGIPPWKVNLQYQKNYTVQNAGDLAGNVNLSTWGSATLPASTNWITAAGDGAKVAIGTSGNQAAYSIDGGKTWAATTMPASGTWKSVDYGNGTFVAIAYNSNIGATSTDGGRTWTQRTLPTGYLWQSIKFGGGTFVLVATGTNNAATTTDGITYSAVTLPATGVWVAVGWGGGTFLIIPATGTTGYKSTTGANGTWSAITLPTNLYANSIDYGNGIFVVVGAAAFSATSIDGGTTWVQRTMPTSGTWTLVKYGNGIFYTVAAASKLVAYTIDGIAYTQVSLPTSQYWLDMSYDNGSFIAVGTGSQVAYLDMAPSSNRTAWLSKEFRTVSDSDASVKTAHLLAPEMDRTTLLVSAAASQTEATRLLNLYKVRRDMLLIRIPSKVVQFMQPGKALKLITDRYGYDSGKMFRIIGTTVDWETGITTLLVWG